MSEQEKRLTSESGAPIVDNQNSQTAGANGPILMQDVQLIEKLARFDRERIPERVVHARGSGAFGFFEVTKDVSKWTKAKFLNQIGKKTEVFARFSTVALESGSPDTVRDPRGFALKFYTEDGNYDLVGNNTPIFFIRDPLKFPDFIHSQKRDPYSHVQDPNNAWDFFSHSPELTHQFTILHGDRGIPYSYRHMDGFGSHTFQWMNEAGEAFWVKYHIKTDQGIKNLTAEEAKKVAGENPNFHHLDLLNAIDAGDYPTWTVSVQIMPIAEADNYRFNPFDLTKTWSQRDYPRYEIGKLVLNRNPENYFSDVEQAAFNPGNFVPGIGPSPDKMLQGRLFAYGDAQRYRLGVNHTQLPVNRPHACEAANYGRDGAMRFDGNCGRQKNYEPNSHGGPAESKELQYKPIAVQGEAGYQKQTLHKDDNDFVQAGDLYRLIPEDSKARLIEALAGSLSQVVRDDVVERSLGYFKQADPDYGDRLAKRVAHLRSLKAAVALKS